MKKLMSIILTGIMAVSMIGSVSVNAQAEEESESGRRISDVVQAAKEVADGTCSACSIPLRVQNDICRVWINTDWQTGELYYETEMLWGKYNPNPAPVTEQDIRDILMGALK